MAEINLDRRALINWPRVVAGDTFSATPVSFAINGVPEDFSESTLTMSIKRDGKLIKQLTVGNGITVSANVVQYYISAADMAALFYEGIYSYEVQKNTSGIIQTIQYGSLTIKSALGR